MNAPARVSGYQNAHQALCDRRLVQSMYSECSVLMERVLLTLHGEAHTCRRAIEWKLFRRDFARYYEREVYPATLKRTLAPYLTRGHLDLPEFGFRVNINLSADIAGNIRTEVDVDPETKFGEVEVSAGEVGRQGSLQCGGIDLALVVARKVAAEQLPFDGASAGMCLAVQRQQYTLHQHTALAVHGLHQAPVAQGLMGILVAADAGGRIHGVRKAPDRWPRRRALRLRFFAAPGRGWAACRAQSVP